MSKKYKIILKLIWWQIHSKYRHFKIWLLNPSRLLSWFLIILTISFFSLVALGKGYFDHLNVAELKNQILPTEWATTTGIYFAVSGWITNAIVTMRNSVKQHSINTLLQSRISKVYLDEGTRALTVIAAYTVDNPAPANAIEGHKDQDAVDYVLNYIEFLAVGVKHGDLHEDVMKDSMRGIVNRFTTITMPYIKEVRNTHGPRTFQNLLWLRKRWKG